MDFNYGSDCVTEIVRLVILIDYRACRDYPFSLIGLLFGLKRIECVNWLRVEVLFFLLFLLKLHFAWVGNKINEVFRRKSVMR